MKHAEYFIDAVSDYQSDFVCFPELFNTPLMADYNHMDAAHAMRELAKFTKPIVDEFSKLAVSYNVNIIAGSMPKVEEDSLYNVSYLFRRNGSMKSVIKFILPLRRSAHGASVAAMMYACLIQMPAK